MSKHRICANDQTRPVEPVSTWENDARKGHALCADFIFREHIEETQELRDRQAAYLASLPTDSTEVAHAALKLMHPNADQYPDGIEEALHLSCALEVMVKEGEGVDRASTVYVAQRVYSGLLRATKKLELISDILVNATRIERDG